MRHNWDCRRLRSKVCPPETHFAQVLVEADYRMKLIGIGLEQPPVKIKLRSSSGQSRVVWRAMRWFGGTLRPDYKCVRVTEDGLAMEMVGWGVKLVGQAELVSSEGGRAQACRSQSQARISVESSPRCIPTGQREPGLRPAAEPDRPVGGRGFHPAAGLL